MQRGRCFGVRNLSYKRLLKTDGTVIAEHGDFNKQAMVSFSYDDGYKNNYTIAAPLHEQYNIPASFNIVTDWVIKNNRYSPIMTVEEIQDLASRGFEIAAHSKTHGYDAELYPDVYPNPKYWSQMTRHQNKYEIESCKAQLEEWGISPKGFVSPFFNLGNDKFLYYDFKYIRNGENRLETYPPFDPYNLPSAFWTQKNNTVAELKIAVDQAITEKKWLIITMHHVIEEGDTAVIENSNYYWYDYQLAEILQYISSKPKEQILPVTTYDGLRYAVNV